MGGFGCMILIAVYRTVDLFSSRTMGLHIRVCVLQVGRAIRIIRPCRRMSSSPLISTCKLNERLKDKDPALVVLDTAFIADRSKDAFSEIYMKGHIPTARHFDLHACVTSTPLIPRNLPEAYCFTKSARKLGINQMSDIVVYDHTDVPEAAARIWWIFRLFGCTQIRILDGGYRKWVEDGYDVITDTECDFPEGDFEAKLDMSLIRDMDDMKQIIRERSSQIVDARNEDLFTGENDHSETLSGGHIPGARNLPNASLFNDDGTYKSKEEIEKLFEAAGVDLHKPFISMCRTAMMACSLATAAHIVGRPDVPVYYGSWMEWAQVQTNPTEKTAKPAEESTGR